MMGPRARRFECRDALQRLYEYLDQDLTVADEAAVDQHLHVCEACRRRFRFEERLIDRIRKRGRADRAPTALRERVERLLAAA
jgi:anti-sigma factor (TIGR02949 family)